MRLSRAGEGSVVPTCSTGREKKLLIRYALILQLYIVQEETLAQLAMTAKLTVRARM